MKKTDLSSMSIDDLWALHEEITAILSKRIEAEKLKLEKRLERIQGQTRKDIPERRPYPQVHAKFRNPEPPHQTWSGRGKQPKWMAEAIAKGKTADDLRISPRSASADRKN